MKLVKQTKINARLPIMHYYSDSKNINQYQFADDDESVKILTSRYTMQFICQE